MTTQAAKPQGFGWGIIIAGILAIVLLSAIPLIIVQDSEFGGADGLGADTVSEIAPDYNSEWITNVWSPPGGETESALFALQAAFGGILIGYFLGYLRGKKKGAENSPSPAD
jgi:cobalt/nickel transport protein